MLSLRELSHFVNSNKAGIPPDHGLKQSSLNLDQSGGNMISLSLLLVSRILWSIQNRGTAMGPHNACSYADLAMTTIDHIYK